MNKNPVFGKIKLPPPWALWLLLGLLAVAASGVVVYAWRVFYSLDARGWPARLLFLAGAVFALVLVGAAVGCGYLNKKWMRRCWAVFGLLVVYCLKVR